MNILCVEHYAGSPAYGMEFRPYHFAGAHILKHQTYAVLAERFLNALK